MLKRSVTLFALALLAACSSDSAKTLGAAPPGGAQDASAGAYGPSAGGSPRGNAQGAPGPGGWLDTVQERISAGEYALRPEPDGALRAFNRAQGMRVRFDAAGVDVRDANSDAGPRVRLGLRGAGRGERVALIEAGAFREGACRADGALDERGECLRRAERTADGVTEWWENRRDGLEQGFTLARAPEGEGPLAVEVAVDGVVEVDEDGRGASIAVEARKLRYAGLSARDARGRSLPARLRAVAGGVAIEVDDAGAAYPIVLDPVLSAAAWNALGGQADAHLGWSVASAGDVNGDGYGDVIVGASDYDNGQNNEGRAYVYYGGASGLGVSSAWSAESNVAGAEFGTSVASAGDVNGDGYGDIVVGAPFLTNGQDGEGRAYVYHGGPSGLATSPAWTFEPNQADARLGRSVASAGDVDGDGYGDVIVGAPAYTNGESFEGRAFIYRGSPTGLAASAAWTLESNLAQAVFGTSVASAGDVNGDGYGDVVVGASNYNPGTDGGRAFVYLGGPSGLVTTAAWSVTANKGGSGFGQSVAGAGDVNGDGYGDVVVGAPSYTNGLSNQGRVYVYLGGAGGLATAAAWFRDGDVPDGTFGASVASAGDVNGDGLGDVIVGAPTDNAGGGTAYAFLGQASAIGLTTMPAWIASDPSGTSFGASVASAGDVNGDGFGDVIVGAPYRTGSQLKEGGASVYLGSAGGLATTAAWTAESNQAGANLGFSVASAGDVNGDGFGDVVVGVPYYTNGETKEGRALLYLGGASGLAASAAWTAESNQASAYFGSSVASAGDVNGDGYGDVIVGAPYYGNGETFEGRAFVYLGNAGGLSAAAAWTAESDQANTHFGQSVAGAGDVNGDGYGDVVVGAPNYTDTQMDEGRAYVYLGGANGLSATAAWTGESAVASAEFGASVASAGDVNGDAFGDVIVGAPKYANGVIGSGHAYVFLGSANGLAATAVWTAESDKPDGDGSDFGGSVASAGDVNGDGYGDVIIGAPRYGMPPNFGTGRALVYLGQASGVSTTAAWITSLAQGEVDAGYSNYGFSVASVGDVNGDGYGDVIVGAPTYVADHLRTGVAAVYLGSAGGLSPTADWTGAGLRQNERFGASLASAGDVNGDGYADVIVGSPGASVATSLGRASLFMGGAADEGAGVPLRPQARQPGKTTPVAPWGRVAEITKADLAVLSARSPMGRTRAKLEVEAKSLGVAFDGLGLVRSATWTSTGVSGAIVTDALSTLVKGTAYHWRARLLYEPAKSATWLRSRWLYGGISGSPRGVHFRTLACVNDAGCAAGQYCASSGRCEPKKAVGATCGAADCQSPGCSMCASGTCNGVCTCGAGKYWNGSACATCGTCAAGQYLATKCTGTTTTDTHTCAACNGGASYACGSGQYRTGSACPGNGTSDTQTCAACGTCTPGQYFETQCTGTTSSDTHSCKGCGHGGASYACATGQYKSGSACTGSGTSDTQTCAACGTCTAGQYLTMQCTGATSSDTHTCAACGNGGSSYDCGLGRHRSGSACSGDAPIDTQSCALCGNGGASYACGGDQYASGASCTGTGTSDTQTCASCTSCLAGQYVASACTTASDTVCATCAAGTYSTTTDAASCTPCTACAAGEYAATACTTTSDTVCASCTPVARCASSVTCTSASDSSCGACEAGYAGPTCSACADTAYVFPSCGTCTSDDQCTSGHYCTSATDGKCVAKKTAGAAHACAADDLDATGDHQCEDGHCEDGYCCTSACGDGDASDCQACDVAGKEGTCSPLPDGTTCRDAAGPCDVAEACDGTSISCPTDGFQPSTFECSPASCANDTATLAAKCTGSSAPCPAPETLSCAPSICAGTACGGCASDAQCLAGQYCAGGICAPKKAIAASCGGTNECASGFCVDGVCCDTACDGGVCDTCAAPGQEGKCTAVDPSTVCRPATSDCDFTETCGGAMTCPDDAWVADGTACADDGNPCTQNLCASGACVHPSDDGASCDDGDPCTQSDVCTGAACQGVLEDGCHACTTASDCDDQDPCTADLCNGATSTCEWTPIAACADVDGGLDAATDAGGEDAANDASPEEDAADDASPEDAADDASPPEDATAEDGGPDTDAEADGPLADVTTDVDAASDASGDADAELDAHADAHAQDAATDGAEPADATGLADEGSGCACRAGAAGPSRGYGGTVPLALGIALLGFARVRRRRASPRRRSPSPRVEPKRRA